MISKKLFMFRKVGGPVHHVSESQEGERMDDVAVAAVRSDFQVAR
jgi:hypothetical protein